MRVTTLIKLWNSLLQVKVIVLKKIQYEYSGDLNENNSDVLTPIS